MWNDLQPALQRGGQPQQAQPQASPAPAPPPQAPPPQAAPPQGGPAPQQGQPQIPAHIAQNVDPKNPIAMALIERVEKLTPQDVQAFVSAIQPPAVAVLKKIIPEIGFLIDRAIAGAQGGAPQGAAPMPPQGAPPPQVMPPAPPQAAPPQASQPRPSGLRSI